MVKPLEYVPEHFNIKLEMANEYFMMITFSVFICLRKSTLQPPISDPDVNYMQKIIIP